VEEKAKKTQICIGAPDSVCPPPTFFWVVTVDSASPCFVGKFAFNTQKKSKCAFILGIEMRIPGNPNGCYFLRLSTMRDMLGVPGCKMGATY